uniref:Myosin subfamily VIII heavy chain n=1 Tax=Petroselinum crispum TaxID=4043 RepID=Q9FPM4_PETCR|nr:myosin subfamily VIII heavy chain [Petroselinum crispum]
MLSVSPSMLYRSSLEEMLDSLRRRDEEEKPRDLPPALPSRPTSKARRPSTKRTLPTNFENNSEDLSCGKKQEVKHSRSGSFGGKKLKEGGLDESPYVVSPALEDKQSVSSSASLPRFLNSDLNDNFDYFIKKKLRVWRQLQNGQWESGHIQSISTEMASVLLKNGSVVTVSAEDLLPANPDVLEGVDDLMELSYLNEPSVLYNLEYRYSHDLIYSMSGPVLIATNPFKNVELYGNDYVTAYRQKLLDSPHVYSVANTAYNEMMRDGINQAIIISGESGSGKTETANVALQYLESLGGGNDGIELQLMQTSHVLEAFGNAKTSLNDNSSRFGKSIAVYFNDAGNICGAKIQTFLLEKSRVVHQARGERSYHIFYQLCAGAPSALKEKLNLKAASEYKYLNQSCLGVNNVDDAQMFQILLKALSTLSISKEDQEHVFEVVAAVLWLGNISFQVIGNENHVEVVADEALSTAASLIGCRCEDLMLALSTSKSHTEKDNVAKNLILQQAIDKRDELAKFVYASLFNWLVYKINGSMEKGELQDGRSISILDIYGFESVQKNSLEQLFINYASERLHQHFIRHLLKLQQEEYDLDGIDWTNVEYRDNKDCLDLFEKRQTGLISLLGEESRLSKTSNLTFAEKLNQHCKTNPCFNREQGGAFTIRHYAGEVQYNSIDFLEKNRDSLHSDITGLLLSCSGQLPHLFASNHVDDTSVFPQRSVGTKLKAHLFKLMHQLENSTPHFILCIKPNRKQIPGMFEKELVLKQLRCCEILQVVRISRSGYPTRLTHQEFAERYGILSKFDIIQDPLSASVSVLQQFGIQPEMYQVGYTRLYFRTGQNDALEEARKQVLQGTLEVQKCFRCHQARRYFHELKRGVTSLQSFVRATNARRKYNHLINLKKQAVQKTLDEQQRAVLQLQAVIRGWLVRRQSKRLLKLRKSNQENIDSSHNLSWRISDVKKQETHQESNQVLPLVIEELRRRVLMAETNLENKEQENAALQDQVQQYEARWVEYEGKMKLMEDMWQKQTASLQMSLAAVKKSLADSTSVQSGKGEGSPSPHYYDSDDNNSMQTQTPDDTPIKITSSISEFGAGRLCNGNRNAVSHLMKEFEQRKQTFDNEAKAIIEVKSGGNPDEELRSLKNKFETWMKDYKARLREAKTKLQKLPSAEKRRRNLWCGGISKW